MIILFKKYNGALVTDGTRGITNIAYDDLGNPRRIQLTDGNVTKYVYSATGEKLRVVYQTAVPNITVAIGSTRELMPSEILFSDSTDYLLGGALMLKNGRIDKFLFEEGYCQATRYNTTQDNFAFLYYDRDHLGNVRQVTKAIGSNGTVVQTMNYYPFGAQFCDGSAATSDFQQYKYNGKELDKMHGLNTYDYGARQYNPITARWDRVDPLAEKYYGVSPYVYCHNNPIMYVDPDGRKDTTFVIGKDRPVSRIDGSETPINDKKYIPQNEHAYNCHSYAWENGHGDPTDPRNAYNVSIGLRKWDENPDNNMGDYYQLDFTTDNMPNDRVLYYVDSNDDNRYNPGEEIVHSAIVFQVDKNGFTELVISKMGSDAISINHPLAPRFYNISESSHKITSRAYFRNKNNQ